MTFVFLILLGFVSITGADTSVTLWQGGKEGAVSITFDDGATDQFNFAFPMLQERDLKATFFIIAEKLELTWYPDHLVPLIADGQEIGSHGYKHEPLTAMSEPNLINELQLSQVSLKEFTGQDVATIAYPYGDYDANVMEHTREYYIAARSTDFPSELNASSPDSNEFYRLFTTSPYPYYAGDQTVDPNIIDPNVIDHLKDGVDRAVSEKKWFIEMLHAINSGYDAISGATFGTHLDYLLAREPNVWVAPMGTVSEYIYERDSASIATLVQDKDMIRLDLQCGLGRQFNTPLTLLTPCPPGWESVDIQVRQNNEQRIADKVFRDDGLYIMYNAIPDSNTIELTPLQAIHTITASAGTNGSITPSGEVFAGDGSDKLFTATPDAGYQVNQWIVDGSEVQTGGTEYTLNNITSDHAVEVTFELQMLTVTATAGMNGTIDPNSPVMTIYGSDQIFTAAPDAGYQVDQWIVNGEVAQAGGTQFTLANIITDNTVEVTFKMYSAAVALWQGDKKGVVSITFNSGFPSQVNAFELLQQYGLKATFYRASSHINDPNDILDLVADGQEIGSQAVDSIHLPELSYDDMRIQLEESQDILQVLTGQDISTIAYPYGDYDPNVIDLADDYYIAARSADSSSENAPNGLNASSPALYELVVIEPQGNGQGDPNIIAWLNNRVDLAVVENKWAIEIFNDVNVPGGYENLSVPALSEHMNYLVTNKQDVWVAPVGMVSEYIYERNSALINTVVSNSNLIQLDLQCIGLDPDIFNTPLTLLTLCPPGWESSRILVRQGNNEQIADFVSKNNNLYIMYNALPDADVIDLLPTPVIYGRLLEPDHTTAIEGVLIETGDGLSSDVTDQNGYYELVVEYGWSGTVEPNAVGYAFDPNETNRTLTNVVSDTELNLTGSLGAFVISGTILEDDGITPIPGVTVTPENGGGYYTAKYDDGGVGTTDGTGYYEVLVDYDWFGDVTPTDNAYVFDPNKISYSNVTTAVPDQNYAGTMLTFSISGYIANTVAAPVEGVTVTADNGGGTGTTDAVGYYEVWVPYDWSGNVAATKADYTFVPATAVYANIVADQSGNFTARLDADIDNSGDVGLSDLMMLCGNWLSSDADLSMGDLDSNTRIDLYDLSELAEYWQK